MRVPRRRSLEPLLRRASVVPLVVLKMGALGRGALTVGPHPAATARAAQDDALRHPEGFRDADAAPAGAVADLGFVNNLWPHYNALVGRICDLTTTLNLGSVEQINCPSIRCL